MSHVKKDQLVPSEKVERIRLDISRILREEFSNTNSAIKTIARDIDANPRGVKNWYNAKSAPNLAHFIGLTAMSPTLLCWFLQMTGYVDLAFSIESNREKDIRYKGPSELQFYGVIFDTKTIPGGMTSLQRLNQRQIWFYTEVYKNRGPNSQDLSDVWKVSLATAKRDISQMTQLGLVRFSGSRRKGRYELCRTI